MTITPEFLTPLTHRIVAGLEAETLAGCSPRDRILLKRLGEGAELGEAYSSTPDRKAVDFDPGNAASLRRALVQALVAREDLAEQRRRLNSRVASEMATDLIPLSIETLEAAIRRQKPGSNVRIVKIEPLFSHSSKQAFRVETDGGDGWPELTILRREPAFSIVEGSVVNEFDVLNEAHNAGLPVPRALLATADPTELGGRTLLMAFAEGRAQPITDHSDRATSLLTAAAHFLAELQTVDTAAIPRFRGATGSALCDSLAVRIAELQKRWLSHRIETSALIEIAFAWLTLSLPKVSEQPAIVHGDFDTRNMLVSDGQLTTVIDWEMSRLGHRAEDLAYFRYDAEKVDGWIHFLKAYEASAGPIEPFDICFFEVLAWVWRLVVVVVAYTGFQRGEHADTLYASTRIVEYEDHLDRLATALSRAMAHG